MTASELLPASCLWEVAGLMISPPVLRIGWAGFTEPSDVSVNALSFFCAPEKSGTVSVPFPMAMGSSSVSRCACCSGGFSPIHVHPTLQVVINVDLDARVVPGRHRVEEYL